MKMTETHIVQRNTEEDPSRVEHFVVPYLSLSDLWHLEKAAQYVGTQTISKRCADTPTGHQQE